LAYSIGFAPLGDLDSIQETVAAVSAAAWSPA
jgi:hypothetical protein